LGEGDRRKKSIAWGLNPKLLRNTFLLIFNELKRPHHKELKSITTTSQIN
jgi:hypothetical protein